MATSIGSLYIDITARTAELEKDMAKVKKEMDKVGTATKAVGKDAAAAFKSFEVWDSFQGRGMMGITLDMWAFMMAISAVQKELKHVWDNIERIPGINPVAIASVTSMKEAVYDARIVLDGWMANVLGWGADYAKAIGYTFGAGLIGMQDMYDAIEKNEGKLTSPDKKAMMEDIMYLEKVGQAQRDLTKARKADEFAAMSQGDRVNALRKEAAALQTRSGSPDLNALESIKLQTEAYQMQKQASSEMTSMRKIYVDNLIKETMELDKSYIATLSQRDAMKEMEKQIAGIRREWDATGQTGSNVENDPKKLEAANKYYPQLIKWIQMLRHETNSMSTASLEFRNVFVSQFQQIDSYLTSFITGGEKKMSEFLKGLSDQIVNMFFKLAVINPILNTLFGGSKGFGILPTLLGGPAKKADGGPASGLTLVGERGPELLNLHSGSSIIPNHQIRGGGGGDQYFIDARGADEARIQQLEQTILGLNATFERRAVAATMSARNRRQI